MTCARVCLCLVCGGKGCVRVLHILSVEHYVSQCNESFAVDVLRFEEIIIIVVNQAAGGRPALFHLRTGL